MPFKDPEQQKSYDRTKYLRNREKILARVKKRADKMKPEISAYYSDWQKRTRPERNAYIRLWRHEKQSAESKAYERMVQLARKALHYAIRVGKIVRPENCSKCGKKCRVHGHHSDYSKRLSVVWLCHACHLKAHNGSFNSPRR